MFEAVWIDDLASKCLPERFLGEGAFGQVSQVMYAYNGGRYALKHIIFNSEADAKFANTEIAIQERLNHPNLARIAAYEVSERRGEASLLLELLAGGTLQKKLDRHNYYHTHMPLPLVESYLMQMLDGLGCMHQTAARQSDESHQGSFVHRDIKPENLLFTDRKKKTMKIADFGLACYVAPGDKVLDAAGTWTYQAPEIHLRQPYDAKSDVYSVGCVAYYMLTGHHPFAGYTQEELREHYSSGVPVDMTAAYARDAGLASLIERMLQFNPDERISATLALEPLKCRQKAAEKALQSALLIQKYEQQLANQEAMYQDLMAQQAEQIRQLQEREKWNHFSQVTPQEYFTWYSTFPHQQEYQTTPQQGWYSSSPFAQAPREPAGMPWNPAYAIAQASGDNVNAGGAPGSPDAVEMLLSTHHAYGTGNTFVECR